jgi:phage shock protein PspC (stress-responsive transcriptional regulator)
MKEMKKCFERIWEEYSTGVAIIIIVCGIVGGLATYFGIMCLQSWLVMLLWNWVAVDLFGAPILGFWTAFGLRWLCSLLFKSNTTVNKKSEN